MGYRLAEAAWERGAEVHAHHRAGRRSPPPVGVRCAGSRPPTELRAGGARGAARRPTCWSWRRRRRTSGRASPATSKRPRIDGALAIPLEPTADILPRHRAMRAGRAASSSASPSRPATRSPRARPKLERKELDLIVVNDALEPGAGFEVDTNRVTILDRDGSAHDRAARSRSARWPRRSSTRWRRALGEREELGGGIWRSRWSWAERRWCCRPAAAVRQARHVRQEPQATSGRVAGEPASWRRPRPPKWRKDAPPIPGPGLTIVTDRPAISGRSARRCRERWTRSPSSIAACTQVRAVRERAHDTVPGEGNPDARLMCVGEGPGATEDADRPPVRGAGGRAARQDPRGDRVPAATVYIANIVKCRPPQNRKPLPDEIAACLPYLHRQIAADAAEGDARARQHRRRGAARRQEEPRRAARQGASLRTAFPLVVTYHPAALLRNPNWKKPTWDDVRIARQLLDR